jgi:hypothetical protein
MVNSVVSRTRQAFVLVGSDANHTNMETFSSTLVRVRRPHRTRYLADKQREMTSIELQLSRTLVHGNADLATIFVIMLSGTRQTDRAHHPATPATHCLTRQAPANSPSHRTSCTRYIRPTLHHRTQLTCRNSICSTSQGQTPIFITKEIMITVQSMFPLYDWGFPRA